MKASEDLSKKAYRYMKKELINYPKDHYISARAVASEVGMSYIPVRDALNRLQSEGFVRKIPKVGYFAVKLDISEVIQLFQARECIEVFVLDEMFDLIEKEHIERLASLIEKQKKELSNSNISEYVKIDRDFHQIFTDIYGNPHFSNLIKNVREQYMICSNKIAKSSSAEGIDEHVQLLKFIKEGNKEKAVHTLKTHIQLARQRMKDGFIAGL